MRHNTSDTLTDEQVITKIRNLVGDGWFAASMVQIPKDRLRRLEREMLVASSQARANGVIYFRLMSGRPVAE